MDKILEFLKKINKLKHVKREGWVIAGVSDPESVASHSYMCSLLTYIFATKTGIDVDKAIKMALIHDLGESITGDITPHDKITSKNKYLLEKVAITTLCGYAKNKEMLSLWNEYELRKTPEAKFVYEVDKLEMAIQAFNYEKEHPDKNFDEFWMNTSNKVTIPCLKKVYDMFYSLKKQIKKKNSI